MSFNSLNTSSHQQQSLAIKREPFDSSGSVAIKLESLEQSPSKHSYPAMHHLGGNGNYCSSPNDLLKCKKRVTNFAKMNYNPSPHTPHQPSVARRNERERNRVKMVNNGFATLRQHVPNGAKNKKMSKVETLRSAVEYIRQLQKLLGPGSSEHSFSLEQFSNSEAANSNSGDENCYPSPMSGHHIEHSSPLESSAADHHQMEHQMNYSSAVSNLYSSMAESMYGLQSPTSSENMSTGKLNNTYSLTSPSERISPTPSVASSDMTSSSSPYDNHPLMETNIVSRQQTVAVAHEDELFDFSSWF